MLQFPLLSDAYSAALDGVHEPRPESAPRDGAASTPCPIPPVRPIPGREAREEDDAVDTDDDMETARTRPLRRDQIFW